MAFLRKKSRSAHEHVLGLVHALEALAECGHDQRAKAYIKARDDAQHRLALMAALFHQHCEEPYAGGAGGAAAESAAGVAQQQQQLDGVWLEHVESELCAQGVLLLLVDALPLIEFESRKDVVDLFAALLRRQDTGGTRYPCVEHLSMQPGLADALLHGCTNVEIALFCGRILRLCVPYPLLSELLLASEHVALLMDLMEDASFEVAADAYHTLHALLTSQRAVASEYLESNFDTFFARFLALLESDNYATRRHALTLLGALLRDRTNHAVTMRLIQSVQALRTVMNLLCDRSRAIQLEAFHIFKMFVAAPAKPAGVLHLLRRNTNKLVTFLTDFHKDRRYDDAFLEEKAFLINNIQSFAEPSESVFALS